MIFSHGKSDVRGVLIGFREAVKYKIKARYVDKNGRYIVLDVLIDIGYIIWVAKELGLQIFIRDNG